MTADWVDLPHDVIKIISNCIVYEVKGINGGLRRDLEAAGHN